MVRDLQRQTELPVLEPTVWSVTNEPVRCRLSPRIAHFVAVRDYEQRHPDMDYKRGCRRAGPALPKPLREDDAHDGVADRGAAEHRL